MRLRFKKFNRLRIERLKSKTQNELNVAQIKIGVGINADFVISGNIGSTKRMEFTSIGGGVNLGSRLEGTSKTYGTDIIFSENTFKACGERLWTMELDRIQVKGENQPVSIYELIGFRSDPLGEKHEQIIEHYNNARQFYHARKFSKAVSAFAEVLELDCHNKSASLHLTRCQHFLLNSPFLKIGMEFGGLPRNSFMIAFTYD